MINSRIVSKSLKRAASQMDEFPADETSLGLTCALLSKIIQKCKSSNSKLTPLFSSALTELSRGLNYLSTLDNDFDDSPSETYERHFDNSRSLDSLLKELKEQIELI